MRYASLAPWMAAAVLSIFAVIPTGFWDRFPVICVWRNLLGWQCLTCGVMRSVSLLLHGRLNDAAHMNRLGFLVVATLGMTVVRAMWFRLRAHAARRRSSRTRTFADFAVPRERACLPWIVRESAEREEL
jgi:hypothetical protein